MPIFGEFPVELGFSGQEDRLLERLAEAAPYPANIALTAPYMHDGSIATLDEVLDHYAAGGRTLHSGPYAGVGSDNPFKSELIAGFTLSEVERAELLAFLESLTDQAFVEAPGLADPWGD